MLRADIIVSMISLSIGILEILLFLCWPASRSSYFALLEQIVNVLSQSLLVFRGLSISNSPYEIGCLERVSKVLCEFSMLLAALLNYYILESFSAFLPVVLTIKRLQWIMYLIWGIYCFCSGPSIVEMVSYISEHDLGIYHVTKYLGVPMGIVLIAYDCFQGLYLTLRVHRYAKSKNVASQGYLSAFYLVLFLSVLNLICDVVLSTIYLLSLQPIEPLSTLSHNIGGLIGLNTNIQFFLFSALKDGVVHILKGAKHSKYVTDSDPEQEDIPRLKYHNFSQKVSSSMK
ncbi:hypothetical protein EDD86DRAFT_199824 [Gorgonomyces haynaldii]|nr:hypothetical protein EDD86DRAFT_199824 [Gorgonomyces haynaldii]